jgi:hypothetical protein
MACKKVSDQLEKKLRIFFPYHFLGLIFDYSFFKIKYWNWASNFEETGTEIQNFTVFMSFS